MDSQIIKSQKVDIWIYSEAIEIEAIQKGVNSKDQIEWFLSISEPVVSYIILKNIYIYLLSEWLILLFSDSEGLQSELVINKAMMIDSELIPESVLI